MSETIESITPPASLARHFYWVAGYSISVCTLYLWGYWSTFDINILQYADLSAVLKIAALPFLIGCTSVVLGAILGHVMFGAEITEEERFAAQNSILGRTLRGNTRRVSVIWIFGTALLALSDADNKWQLLPLLIAVPISVIMSNQEFVARIIPQQSIRHGLVFLAVYAVPYAYANGLQSAERIEAGQRFSYLLSPISGIEITPEAAPEARPRFLGQVNDFVFVYNPTEKSVNIAKFDEQKFLKLKRYTRPSESLSTWVANLWQSVISRLAD